MEQVRGRNALTAPPHLAAVRARAAVLPGGAGELTCALVSLSSSQMLGSRYACVSPSDCIYVTGSHFQSRVHGVYVLSPRHCAGKPVYRQRGPEGLFLHSPAHENQWNVGPDLCDNSPRNKWMELYSTARSASEILS